MLPGDKRLNPRRKAGEPRISKKDAERLLYAAIQKKLGIEEIFERAGLQMENYIK
jgi:hypothetical protein